MSHSAVVQTAPAGSRRYGRQDAFRLALHLVMPLTDLPVAIVSFTTITVFLSLSLGLIAALLIGIPMFIVTGYIARAFAAVERARIKLFLDVEIPQPPRRSPGLKANFTDGPTWRAIAYPFAQFPLAIATFTVFIASIGTALALISMPFWLTHIPARRADLWLLTASDQRTAWLAALVGVPVLIAGISITVGLTMAEGALAKAILGASAAQLAKRVDELEGSRARVVDAAEAERTRIERDLHDGAQQRLVALAMNLGRARARYDTDPESARALLDEAHAVGAADLDEARALFLGNGDAGGIRERGADDEGGIIEEQAV